ncbi:MAG: hypothetical protein HY342_04390 [Candidatus Lambdaproteobacteria bacterium]|nr:hypothetical protein [Candidatus Lambdaproteobacteria bacterium]
MSSPPPDQPPAPPPGTPPPLEGVALALVWLALLAGMALAIARPDALLLGPGPAGTPALVHLFTLGVLLGGFTLLQARQWRRLYGVPGAPPARGLLGPLALGLQALGIVLLAWGFLAQRPGLAHLGGHYLVPTAVALQFVMGLLAMRRRPRGAPRHLAAHLPVLGLMLAVALGAMLVLDAYQGGYGIYLPGTILVHLLAGAFLFVLPMSLWGPRAIDLGALPPAAAPDGPDDAPARAIAGEGLTLQRLVPLPAAGVLLVAVGQTRADWPWAMPAGLAVLGAVCLWVGLPGRGHWQALSFNAVRRTPWAAVGMLVLFAALRWWRGAEGAELVAVARFSAVLLLFVVVLPDLLARLGLLRLSGEVPATPPTPAEPEAIPPHVGLHYAAQLLGASLLVAAVATRMPALVQAGAAVWLLSGLHWGWRLLRG